MTERKGTGDVMQATMQELVSIFPGCAVVLLVAPFDAPEGARTNYVSNAKREDITVFLREVLARFEGRGHDAPGRRGVTHLGATPATDPPPIASS